MTDRTTPAERVRARAVVSGRVQGVSYRFATRSEAGRLGLTGWVRNLPDGSVELVAEGRRDEVEKLLKWCRRGPAFARVDEVEVEWGSATGEFSAFGIAR